MNWKKLGYIIGGYFVMGIIVYILRTILQGHFIDDPTYVLVWPKFALEIIGMPLYLLGPICLPCGILISILFLILGIYLIYLFIKKIILAK